MRVGQQVRGLSQALNRFEDRVKSHRQDLREYLDGKPKHGIDDTSIASAEVETIEALVIDLARAVTGREPIKKAWEPLHPYCSEHEQKRTDWFRQQYEYFRCALLWIEKTRTYLEFLNGAQPDSDEPLVE